MTGPSIGVVVATFGDEARWGPLADRALRSVARQTVVPDNVVRVHADTLMDARNDGAELAGTDQLVFLDADDELDPGYVGAMRTAYLAALCRSDHRTFLLQPATLDVTDGVEAPAPVLLPQRPLLEANFMVIGTMVSTELFFEVGAFRDWPLYEDWDLWIRCWLAGAGLAQVPGAVYRVSVARGGRNLPDRETQVRYYNEIKGQYE